MDKYLEEVKEWIRVDYDEDDSTIDKLIHASSAIIKKTSGIMAEDIKDNEEAYALYTTLQKMLIKGMYDGRDGSSKINSTIIQLTTILSTFKR